jgi:excinuclease UvrABC nuclease subunit
MSKDKNGLAKNIDRMKEERKIMKFKTEEPWRRLKRSPSLHNIQNIYTEQHRAAPYYTAHRESLKDVLFLAVVAALIIL